MHLANKCARGGYRADPALSRTSAQSRASVSLNIKAPIGGIPSFTVHVRIGGEMSKTYACHDARMECEWEVSAETEGELLRLIGKHLAEAHGLTDTSPDLLQQVRRAIKDE